MKGEKLRNEEKGNHRTRLLHPQHYSGQKEVSRKHRINSNYLHQNEWNKPKYRCKEIV